MKKKIAIIGSGFSSLAASCYLAKEGHDVVVFEKNETVGGRARQLKKEGFTFDIGPTFYWMPDVFESFFNDFNLKVDNFYSLQRLNPSYRVYFHNQEYIDLPSDYDEMKRLFESIEKGAAKNLDKFLAGAESNYNLAIKDLVYQPGNKLSEIISSKTIKKLNLFFETIEGQVNSLFKDEKIRKILKFPVLFLGAKPSNTPAFYNFMNFADVKLGTWYPKNGMYSVVQGMQSLAEKLGVKFYLNHEVKEFDLDENEIKRIKTNQGDYDADIVLSGADYAFTESLLPENFRQYSQKYWKQKTFAPSALLFYVGFDTKIENIEHHTLFFDTNFDAHSKSIYDSKIWPEHPLFYASFPSKSDGSAVPEKSNEAAVFLIPIAIDLKDTPKIRELYFNKILARLEKNTGQSLSDKIIFKESYCINDFKGDYHAYGGNAYGLANTLLQTHIFRPKIKSKLIKNLYFTGQLTVPGPGVPPSLISGKIAAEQIQKHEA